METMIIAGLGNPGREYVQTRHNLGFDAVDALAARWKVEAFKAAFKSLYACVSIPTEERKDRMVILLKPQTFMNLSGEAVQEAQQFYRVENRNVLVLVDDLDTPDNTLRLRLSGGAAGHNGLRSIIQHLGGEDFPRVRIGIGRPPGIPGDVYVLAKIPKADRDRYEDLVIRAADAAELCAKKGCQLAMNTVNTKGDQK